MMVVVGAIYRRATPHRIGNLQMDGNQAKWKNEASIRSLCPSRLHHFGHHQWLATLAAACVMAKQ